MHGEHCGATEERDLAAVLDGIAAAEPDASDVEAVVVRSAAEQHEVQLREAVVDGSDTAESGPGRVVGAGEPRLDDAVVVYGV